MLSSSRSALNEVSIVIGERVTISSPAISTIDFSTVFRISSMERPGDDEVAVAAGFDRRAVDDQAVAVDVAHLEAARVAEAGVARLGDRLLGGPQARHPFVA